MLLLVKFVHPITNWSTPKPNQKDDGHAANNIILISGEPPIIQVRIISE